MPETEVIVEPVEGPPVLRRSIFEDLAAGENPILLEDMVLQDFFPRKRGGKVASANKVFRIVREGLQGIKLEVVQCAGSKCSTRGAWIRFCARLTMATNVPEKTIS